MSKFNQIVLFLVLFVSASIVLADVGGPRIRKLYSYNPCQNELCECTEYSFGGDWRCIICNYPYYDQDTCPAGTTYWHSSCVNPALEQFSVSHECL